MNVFANFDEIPSMILQEIKETKHYGHTFVCSDGRTDNVKQYTHPQTQFAGGITNVHNTTVTKIRGQNIFKIQTTVFAVISAPAPISAP